MRERYRIYNSLPRHQACHSTRLPAGIPTQAELGPYTLNMCGKLSSKPGHKRMVNGATKPCFVLSQVGEYACKYLHGRLLLGSHACNGWAVAHDQRLEEHDCKN